MIGTVLPPQVAGAWNQLSGADHRRLTPDPAISTSLLTFYSVFARLAAIASSGNCTDPEEFIDLTLSLSRRIDYAIIGKVSPPKAQDLPLLLKQICQLKSDSRMQAAVMVLVISVKNACKVGWFAKETEQIFSLANEMGSKFCTSGDVCTEPSCFSTYIATIMERFYPRMKMGQIFASLEVKPGYGVYVNDFNIPAESAQFPIQLLVAQVDNLETSATIINPQLVNFLLNGKKVNGRTSDSMDSGPQKPTIVSHMLFLGTNILQAVGQFNGQYIIIIAIMSEMSSNDIPDLQEYVQPLVAGSDSDPDIIEGPSRVSLNCPISFLRMITPVKGHSCRHLQCFDFSNFIDINSRRPSWRCPHCNQSACYTDIRVDQNMVKVLKEVGKDVTNVVISTDGSWRAVSENDEDIDQAHAKTSDCMEERSEQQESTNTSKALTGVIDLTEDDNEREYDTVGTCGIEDMKPDLNNTRSVDQTVAPPLEDDFWAGLFFSTEPATTTAGSATQVFGDVPQSTPATFVHPQPVSTDFVSPEFNPDLNGCINTSVTASETRNHVPSLHNLPVQQMQANSGPVNDFGRTATNPRMVIREPNAVQALPSQFPAQGSQQRLRTSLSSPTPGSSGPYQAGFSPTANSLNTVYSDLERQQHFSRSLSSLQGSNVASSLLQQPMAQNQSYQGASTSSWLRTYQNPHLQQVLNPPMGNSWTPVQQHSAPARTTQASAGAGNQQIRTPVAAPRAGQMARQSPLMPVQSQTYGHVPSFSGNTGRASMGDQSGSMGDGLLMDMPSEQDWRRAGRMRGSLYGRDYSMARDQFMINQPSQTVEPARLASVPGTLPTVDPSHLDFFFVNNMNTHFPPTQQYN
ncbi:hypothetical protein UlMin_002158 [Ulmus minor]